MRILGLMSKAKKVAVILCALMAASASEAKADWDYWAVDYSGNPSIGNRIYTVDSLTGAATLRATRVFDSNGWQPQNSYADAKTGELVIYNGNNGIERYNLDTDTWSMTGVGWVGNYQKVFERPTIVGNPDGTTSIGQGSSRIQIEPNGKGVSTGDGSSLIRVAADGALHIGENSLVTIEDGGVQKLYATDANGKAIPINITNGSDLQINGTSVNSQLNTLNATVDTHTNQINTLNTTVNTHTNQINTLNTRVNNLENNVNSLGSGVAGATALTAALTSLPATSDDSPVSCGVGSGGYSSRYAMGFGCAAKVTERLAFNAGGSFVFGGASNYGGGTLDNVAGRLGFVFKIGKVNATSNQAISKKTANLESQLSEVKEEKQQLADTLTEMKALIAAQNQRLATLEQIAAGSGSMKSASRPRATNTELAQSLK
jgi:hypothetical protein